MMRNKKGFTLIELLITLPTTVARISVEPRRRRLRSRASARRRTSLS